MQIMRVHLKKYAQCDQIRRIFATIVNFLMSLAIFEDLFSNWHNREPRNFGNKYYAIG